MALLTTPLSPNSFQVRLGFKCRRMRSPLVFIRIRARAMDRRIFALSAAGSAARDGDREEQRVSGSSWTNSDSSVDGFSGWNGDDSRGSQPNKGFGGMVGAGLAGVFLAVGLSFASISLSKNNTTGFKQQMKPLTTQEEALLASDDHNKKDEQDGNGRNTGMIDEESLKNGYSPAGKTGTDKDFSSPEITEATAENRSDDYIVKGTPLVQNVEYTSNDIDATNDPSSQDDFQTRTGIDNISVPSDTSPRSSKMPESTIVDCSSDASSLRDSDGELAAGTSQSTNELEGNLDAVSPTDPSVVDASTTNLNTESDKNVSVSMGIEDSSIPFDSTSTPNSQIPTHPLTLDDSINSQLDLNLEPQVVSNAVVETTTLLQKEEGLDLSKSPQILEEGINSALEANNMNENWSSGTNSTSAFSNSTTNEPDTNCYNEIDRSKTSFELPIQENSFSTAGIPAPSVVSAALQVRPGRVVIPAVVDQVQGQALAALQALKVIEPDAQSGDLCTRREYARWLVSASSILSRNSVSKVYPAMYIENVTELAFDDITPEDPDFPFIQGLAEAGLISSKLSRRDMLSSLDEEHDTFLFYPESPVSRQDLVSWKMALDKTQLPEVDRKILYQQTGFIDIDRIHPDAWSALVADLSAGEPGIIALAFGFTRLFQPDKPVTKAQAAVALAIGESADIVSEELARIEAESMAETAVAAHSALVAQVEKDVNANFEKELAMEREKIDAVEKMAEEARFELEKLRIEREEENNALLKARVAVESEMEVLSRLRHDVEEQLQSLMSNKMEISFERDRLNKLRLEAENENQAITRLQYELEVERKALSMARGWAEDEAKKARDQAKALVEARDRWERHGIKVVVDSDLRDDESAAVTWLNAGKQHSIDGTVKKAETLVEKLKEMASSVGKSSRDVIEKIIQKIVFIISVLKEWASEKAKQAQELKDAAVSKAGGSTRQLQHTAGEFGVAVKDGARRIAGDCREGVEKLTQKFKT